MGRKSGRGKEKKLKKKEEEDKLTAMWTLIEAANAMSDPMENLAAFKTFNRHGLNLQISCERVTQLDQSTIDWAFQLTKENMKPLYEKSEWGWNDDEKKKEMSDKKAWYLLVRDSSAVNQSKPVTTENQSKPVTTENQSEPVTPENQSEPVTPENQSAAATTENQSAAATAVNQSKPVALVHFRFDMEDEQQVLYCYEIQLCPEVRRKGLGKFLIDILQLIAFRTGMLKVMVTVFRHNKEAQDFFVHKLKFTEDETSPVLTVEDFAFDDLEGISYQILSKPIKPRQPTAVVQ